MKKQLCTLVMMLNFVVAMAQQDTINIDAKLSENLKNLSVKQSFSFRNNLKIPLKKVKLLNWVAAYRNQGTSLAKRKIEDRSKVLHFAKPQDLGYLEALSILNYNKRLDYNQENLYLELEKELKPGETVNLDLNYELSLPKISITGYGTSTEKVALKYFFLVPDTFETEAQSTRNYNDIEETENGGTYWKVNLEVPQGFFTESNLVKNNSRFEGSLAIDPEFLITKTETVKIIAENNIKNTEVVFGYSISPLEKSALEFYLPLHLNFLNEKGAYIPPKIFLSEKFKNKENFFGNDDIKFGKFKFQMFSDSQKIDLDYFSIISKKVVQLAAISEKTKDHWFKNGLKSYWENQYLQRFYKDTKLLGALPENAKIFGIKPLKMLTASQLKLTERYGLAYQYITKQNLDQKIGEPFLVLSNFNDMAISSFEMGSLFNYLSDKMSNVKFDNFVKNYLAENQGKIIDTKDFLDQLAVRSNYSSNFLETYINNDLRFNFKIKKFRKIPEGNLVSITKNMDFAIPLKITSEDKNGKKQAFWYDTKEGKNTAEFLIPRQEISKIQLNDEYIFPEYNYRDNYLYTKGIFSNTKKPKIKFLKDIPDPEYNEIYINPRISFNAYDKALIGLNLQNKSLFDQQLLYSFTPFYSSGTGKFTGAAAVAYIFRPKNTFFRSLQIGTSGSYFHYDYDLAYRKFSVYSNLNFTKVLRSTISRSLMFSYDYFSKDLNPEMQQSNEYDRYGLWNLGYGYSDAKLIHEIYFGSNLQLMKNFQKLSAEAFYRWEYAENKKISFRFFGGLFFSNNAKNDLFNFGISRVSNYAFSYNLIGQSATSGLLSQQYIQAEGGFKSYINSSVNQWIASTGVDAHVWKMFNIYADAGLYKNKGHETRFIWDSGVKLKVIPDFLEVYLPVQSSLGFEPSFKDYGKRIRYTLVLNFNAFINHFRRGWY